MNYCTMFFLGFVLSVSGARDKVLYDFSSGLPGGWVAEGSAFGDAQDATKLKSDLSSYYGVEQKVPGIIKSEPFVLKTPHLHIKVDGEKLVGQLSLIRVMPDGMQVIRKSLATNLQKSGWLNKGLFSFDVKDYLGETVYFQLSGCYSIKQINIQRISGGAEAFASIPAATYVQAIQTLLDADASTADADPLRPVLHTQAVSGKSWDANGLVLNNGRYHFFYLVRPNGASPVQGHKVSSDLVHWVERPIAVWPSVELGEEGVWSGSAVVDDEGRCHVFYTGVGPDRSAAFGARQGHMISADASFDRFEKVTASMITMADVPVPAQNVRDPFVFREGKTWYLTLTGSVLKKGNESWGERKVLWPKDIRQGAVFLFRSDNLYNWSYAGIAYQSADKPLLEVSDFIKKDDGLWFFSPGGKTYMVGRFDLKNALFTPVREPGRASFGEFYAYHSVKGPDGRNLIMGRLTDGGSAERKWVGTYAFPREWSFDGNVLIQKPARELQSLRREHFAYSGRVSNGAVRIDGAATECELVVEMDRGTASKCGLEIRRSDDGKQGYRVTWDGTKAYCQSIASEGNTPWWKNPISIVPENKRDPDRIEFHVFVDRGLVELFVDDQKTFDRPVESIPLSFTNIAVFAEGGEAEVLSYDRWNLSN